MSEKEEILFCVNIIGPDDVIPVHSMREAVQVASWLNQDYLAIYESLNLMDSITPYCFAVPRVWPGTKEEHRKELCRLKTEGRQTGEPFWSLL